MYEKILDISIKIWEFIIGIFVSGWKFVSDFLSQYDDLTVTLVSVLVIFPLIGFLLYRSMELLIRLFRFIAEINKKKIGVGLLVLFFLATLVIYLKEKVIPVL
jgi:high-affinity nickel permease